MKRESKLYSDAMNQAYTDFPRKEFESLSYSFERFILAEHLKASYRFTHTVHAGQITTKDSLFCAVAECLSHDGAECEGYYDAMKKYFMHYSARAFKLFLHQHKLQWFLDKRFQKLVSKHVVRFLLNVE